MRIRISEDYVSFETAKLLKENGFNVMCDSEYIPDIRHNGRSISFDRELDLKDEGRGDEIEVVEGGQIWDTWNTNSNNSENEYSRPSILLAWKWFLVEHKVEIHPFITSVGWCFEIGDVSSLDITGAKPIYKPGFPSKDNTYNSYCNAIEAGMKWYIENKIRI
jgi:hypothetical protein